MGLHSSQWAETYKINNRDYFIYICELKLLREKSRNYMNEYKQFKGRM